MVGDPKCVVSQSVSGGASATRTWRHAPVASVILAALASDACLKALRGHPKVLGDNANQDLRWWTRERMGSNVCTKPETVPEPHVVGLTAGRHIPLEGKT